MEVLKLKEFNPNKLKAVISKKVRYGEREFTSVRFTYDGPDVPTIRVNGSFRLFNFNSDENRKNDLILIMTPEKQDKTLDLRKHWSVDSTPARNEVIMKRTYPAKSVKCDKICSNY